MTAQPQSKADAPRASAPPGPQSTRPEPPPALPAPRPDNGAKALSTHVEEREPKLPIPDRYVKAGVEPFDSVIQEKLSKVVDPKIVEITPDGRIYIPVVHFRRALNETFGRGGWALIPWSDRIMKGQHVYREYALYARGQFLAETVGEQEYIEKNRRFTYGDAAEGCESNALTRCAKKLDIYSEVWDPGWRDLWKRDHAVCVPCEKQGEGRKYLWKRKDRGRLYSSGWKEIGADTGPPPERSAQRPPQGQRPPQAQRPPSRPTGQAASPRPQGQPAGARPQGQATSAPPAGQARSTPPKATPAPQPGAATRDPNSALYGQVMAGLKRACGSTKDDDARKLLEQFTGKRKCHDVAPETLKALLAPLHKLGKSEAQVTREGDTTVVIDTVTSVYLWPPGYNPLPADEGPQAPPEEAAPPPEEGGPPPLGDEDVPAGYGF